MNTSKKGCWTCKRRKIRCDKTRPWCTNCSTTGRTCQGYDIRLLWPDQHDGRRRGGDFLVPVESLVGAGGPLPEYYGQQFLNTTVADVVAAQQRPGHPVAFDPRGVVARSIMRPGAALTLHPKMYGSDDLFLTYYEQMISSMISTTQVKNGFRRELLPMALSRPDAASSALAQAMMAVAAFHRSGSQAALPYKAKAIRHLHHSFLTFENQYSAAVTETQVAASLMLCVYSVFDESEGNWDMHLDGAKYMIQKLMSGGGNYQPSTFVSTWYLYHEVLGCFTQPLRERSSNSDIFASLARMEYDATQVSPPSAAVIAAHPNVALSHSNLMSQIVGSLGCSVEIIEIIHRTNQLRGSGGSSSSPRTPRDFRQDLTRQRLHLDARLRTLVQRISPSELNGGNCPPARQAAMLATAELYRIAAGLYLHRVAPQPADNPASAVERAFAALDRLEVPTSPWPVFVVACECRGEAQRVRILRALDAMDAARRIGNVYSLRDLIEAFWTQRDLAADVGGGGGGSSLGTWWEFATCDTAMPWFI